MGKGYAIPKGFNLSRQLCQSYEKARSPLLPNVELTAIANDTVSTLVSFTYEHASNPRQRPAMGLIVGTGNQRLFYSSASFPFTHATFGLSNKFYLLPEDSAPIIHTKTSTNLLEAVMLQSQ